MTHLSEAILHETGGIVLTLSDPQVATWLQDYADFFVIDAAARPFAPETVQAIVLAAKDKPVFARVENTSPSTLQNYLNLGVDGLILTGIHYAAEAEKAIAACLYPPEGLRSYRRIFGNDDVSLEAINDQITLIVEIAHPQAIAQLDEIAEVTGVNGVLVCPQRLAVAMEKDVTHVTVQQALQSIVLAARNYDLPWGMERGMEGEAGAEFTPNFLLAVSDAGLLARGLQSLAKTAEDEEDDLRLIASR